MNITYSRLKHSVVFSLAATLTMAAIAHGTVRVGGSSLRANGEVVKGFEYTGSCPVDLKFGWGVISTEPTTITYSYARNDGGHSGRSLTADLPGANRSVPIYVDWHLGTNNQQFANYSGWVQLNIESPNPVSQKIPFTLHCSAGTSGAGASVRIGGWSLRANGQLAQGFQYTGSCPVNLQFGWGVIPTEPTTITYSYARNDGGHSGKPLSADLPSANRSVPIYVDWHLGANNQQFANYSGWIELNIESPNPVSQKLAFTLHCRAESF